MNARSTSLTEFFLDMEEELVKRKNIIDMLLLSSTIQVSC